MTMRGFEEVLPWFGGGDAEEGGSAAYHSGGRDPDAPSPSTYNPNTAPATPTPATPKPATKAKGFPWWILLVLGAAAGVGYAVTRPKKKGRRR